MLLALTNMYMKYWWMVKSSIFKLCTTKYIKDITKNKHTHTHIYIQHHNLGYVEVLSKNAINKVS